MADRELRIRLVYDSADAEAKSQAFWTGEAQRQQTAAASAAQAAQQTARAQSQAYQQAAQAQSAAAIGATLRPSGAPDAGLAATQAAAAARSRAGIIAAGTAPGAAPNLQAAAAAAQANVAAAQANAAAAQTAAVNTAQLQGRGAANAAVVRGLSGLPRPPTGAQARQAGMGGLAIGAAGLGATSAAIQSAAQSQGEANQHIAGITDEMESARASQREIAALRGEAPTGAFAAQMAREAGSAGISPEQYHQFQTAIQAYAGQHRGTKFEASQFDRLSHRVASYAVGARGLAPPESARLLGTLMDKAKPGATDKDIMDQYAKSMQVMQLAPGYTGPLLGQLSEVAGEAVGPHGDFSSVTDASILLRGVAQRNPATVSAYTRALLRCLRETRMDPKESAALGLKKGMDTFQQIEAIQQAADKAVAGGADEGEFLTKHGFGEIRQYGGLRTALDSGLRGGGFQRARDEAAKVDAGTARRAATAYLAGQEGGSQRDRANVEAAKLERANRFANLRKYQRQAEESVEGGGTQEGGEGLGGVLTQSGRLWGEGDRREQEVRAETGRILRQRLRDYRGHRGGHEQAEKFLDEQVPAAFGPGTVRREQRIQGRFASDEELARAANFLEQLVQQGKDEQRRREQADAQRKDPALTVKQPRPNGRMDAGQGEW